MPRHCIDTENTKCTWFKGAGVKIPCDLLDIKIEMQNKMPQSFCPIISGSGGGVKFDYAMLFKHTRHPSWKAILDAQELEKTQKIAEGKALKKYVKL